jgi:hypothetical protein
MPDTIGNLVLHGWAHVLRNILFRYPCVLYVHALKIGLHYLIINNQPLFFSTKISSPTANVFAG